MESDSQSPARKTRSFGNKKKLQQSDIVFVARNGSIQSIPSLGKKLKPVTEPVIGLQFVWEYRSPSKSVPPHYQCRLCKVQRLQSEMIAHVLGWKHIFKYLKQQKPDKVPHEEEEVLKDGALRKALKTHAAELEKAEGRGNVKVVLKEPFDVISFKGMPTAVVKRTGGPVGPMSGCGYPEPLFPGEFPPRGMHPDYSMGMGMRRPMVDMSMGGFLDDMARNASVSGQSFSSNMGMPMKMQDGDMGMRRFPDDIPNRMGADGFGMGSRNTMSGQRFLGEFGSNQVGSRSDMISSMGPEGNSVPATLLKYLDNFRIDNENDAQIVLKVTQKLTDILMEYRLRSVSTGSFLKSTTSSVNSMSFNTRTTSGMDSYPGKTLGSSRYFN